MRNAWYVACTSEELAEGIVACSILSTELLLYRDAEGRAHALHDQCAHRGARLSDGQVRGDCVACPFHGWEYGGDGACKYIPANGPDAPIPERARVAAYPVREVAGLVFVFVGEVEKFTELEVPPELTDPAWRGVYFFTEWEAHVTRVVESVLDVSHLPFVHPESTGEVNPKVEGPDFEVSEREILVYAKPYHPLVATPLNEDESKGMSTITFTWPNQLVLRTEMFSDRVMATYLSITPIDEERIQIHGLALRNFFQDVELIDGVHYEHNVTVLEQDRPVVEGLRPKVSPLDVTQEVHVRSDAQQVRYRQMVRRMQDEEQRGGQKG